jgi:hypothetical protein
LQGFKELDDFAELTEQDCVDFFPFLKVGDRRRLQKAVPLLNESTVGAYEGRKDKKKKGRKAGQSQSQSQSQSQGKGKGQGQGQGNTMGNSDRDHQLILLSQTAQQPGGVKESDGEWRFFPPVLPPGSLGLPRVV